MTDRYKIDSSSTLSQEQYDLIVKYLKTGAKPSAFDIRQCGLEGNVEKQNGVMLKKGLFGRFKAIVKRLKIRQSDNSLVFYSNSKIVIPNNKFVDVIKEAHEAKGHKHLNMTKTLEKLNEKYSMGSRQLGICEETVREVVRACKHGSCAKYSWKKHKAEKYVAANQNIDPKKDSMEVGTTDVAAAGHTGTLASSTNHLLQNLPTLAPGPCPKVEKLIAIPCVFQMPTSLSQQRFSLQLYTGPRATTPTASCSITPMITSPDIIHASPLSLSNNITCTNTLKTANRIHILPHPLATSMPSLLQLLSQPPLGSSGPVVNQGRILNNTNLIQTTMESDSLDHSLNQSESLTNLSQTVGAYNLQQDSTSLDHNNNSLFDADCNLLDQTEDENSLINIEDLEQDEDQGNEEVKQLDSEGVPVCHPLPPMIYPQLWHNLRELNEETEPYKQIILAIKDLQNDTLMATAGNIRAADAIKRKILVLELMIQNAKLMTKAFLPEQEDLIL